MLTRLWMRTCVLRAPEGDGEGEGNEGGAGGEGSKPKTFTQADLSRIAAKEKKDGEKAGRAAAEAEFKARQEELEAKIAELQKANMTAAERAEAERKEREAADKRAREEQDQKRKQQLEAEKKRADTADERWRSTLRSSALSSALATAKVIPETAGDAATIMLGASKIEIDDDGSVKSVIYAGKTYDTLDEAAKQFLTDKPHFAQATGAGGAGTRNGSGGKGSGKRPLHELSRDQLMELDREKRAVRR